MYSGSSRSHFAAQRAGSMGMGRFPRSWPARPTPVATRFRRHVLGLLAICCLLHAVCVSVVVGETNGWLARFVSSLLSDLAAAFSVLTMVSIAALSILNVLLFRAWTVHRASRAVIIAVVPALVSLAAAGLLVLADPALLAWVTSLLNGDRIVRAGDPAIAELVSWICVAGYWLAGPAFALAASVADDFSPQAWEDAIRAEDGRFDPIMVGLVQLAPFILLGGFAAVAILDRFWLYGLAEQVIRWLDTKYLPMLISAAVIVPGFWIATRAWRLLRQLYRPR